MKNRPVKDVAASVRQRLLNEARTSNRPFQEVLQYFAMERFLYRLSVSPHAKKFILKGALMFTVWRGPTSRPTKDIDLLAKTANTVDGIVRIVRDVCDQQVEADGLLFDADSVNGEVIKEDADYSGVRATFRGTLQNARIAMQIDMGFSDVVTPPAKQTDYPTLLDFPAPRLLGYNRGSKKGSGLFSAAEKRPDPFLLPQTRHSGGSGAVNCRCHSPAPMMPTAHFPRLDDAEIVRGRAT